MLTEIEQSSTGLMTCLWSISGEAAGCMCQEIMVQQGTKFVARGGMGAKWHSHIVEQARTFWPASRLSASLSRRSFFSFLASGRYFNRSLNSVAAVLLSKVLVKRVSAGGTFNR